MPIAVARIVHVYPHDPDAFTEGLFYRDGQLFESAGPYNRSGGRSPSTIRRVRLVDGRVLQRVETAPDQFGEGIVDNGGEIVSLTWRGGIGFRWSLGSFKQLGSFRYAGEGWALTRIPGRLVMSDGTANLRFLDPETLREVRRIGVTIEGQPLRNLNEIEYAKGEVLANIWHSDFIARIDPRSGKVKGLIDLSALPRPPLSGSNDGVANGIAYDAKGDRLFVTGKNWPQLYEIGLRPVGK